MLLWCVADLILHSFPTRRSSDLRGVPQDPAGRCAGSAHATGDRGAPAPRAFARRHLGRTLSGGEDRKSTRLNSSHMSISLAVFCLKNKRIGVADERTVLIYRHAL